MKLHSALAFLAASLSLSPASAASGVRGQIQDMDESHERRLGENGCTFLIVAKLAEKGVDFIDESFECELDDGTAFPIVMDAVQQQYVEELVEQGKVNSGKSKLQDRTAIVTPKGIQLTPGQPIQFKNGLRSEGERRRRLVTKTGQAHYLVVRVIDKNSKAHPHNTATMSDNMFGTNGDPVNLKSQISACSNGQLIVTPGYPSSTSESQKTQIDNVTTGANHPVGVMEAKIAIDITTAQSRYDVRNAVISKVNALLGFNLPGPFDHVVFNLEGCYNDCGWAAYAYINSWNQVYQGNYYYMTGVQVHEYGHNLGMAHSGGLNGATYTDHTCMMGNPLYSDDLGKMCFNPAKSYYIGWYNTGGIVEVNPDTTNTWSGTLMGVGEWGGNPGAYPVVVKIETGANNDYYVGFNRAAGANAENDEADNEVTIIETGNNGLSYSQSFLKAHLLVGEQYTINNWKSTGRNLVITVDSITISSTPGTAYVRIELEGAPTPAPVTPPPTPAPVTPAPVTPAPVTPPPTPAPVTPPPTPAPVTPPPTPAPVTPPPTPAPVCNLAANGDSCVESGDCCSGQCSGGKRSTRVCLGPVAPTSAPAPTPAPAPTTTCFGRNSWCSANSQCCSGNCRNNGKCA